MPLQWHQPYELNPNAPSQDQRSLANLNQTIGGIGDDWQKYGQNQRQNRLQQAYLTIQQAEEARKASEYAHRDDPLPQIGDQSDGYSGGGDNMTPGGTQSWNPSPLDMGRQSWAQSPSYETTATPTVSPPQRPIYPQMAGAGTPDTGYPSQNGPQPTQMAPQGPQSGQPMHQPGTDLTAHFNAWKQQGGGPYNHPEMSGMKSDPTNPMSGLDLNTVMRWKGQGNRTEGLKFLEEGRKQQETQDRYGTGATGLYSTPEQAAFQMSPNDEAQQARLIKKMQSVYPDGRIPKSAITGAAGGIHVDMTHDTNTDKFNQTEWDKVVKSADPLDAGGRSAIGMAAKANLQADTAVQALNRPMVTVQEAGNVMADMASIYQRGSATQFGMSEQAYHTAYSKIQGALQYLTGKPRDAVTPEIKARLMDTLKGLKGVNNSTISKQLDLIEHGKSKIINSGFQDEWKKIRHDLEGDQGSGGQGAGGQGGGGWSYVGKVQ